jgi:hypothetical protein
MVQFSQDCVKRRNASKGRNMSVLIRFTKNKWDGDLQDKLLASPIDLTQGWKVIWNKPSVFTADYGRLNWHSSRYSPLQKSPKLMPSITPFKHNLWQFISSSRCGNRLPTPEFNLDKRWERYEGSILQCRFGYLRLHHSDRLITTSNKKSNHGQQWRCLILGLGHLITWFS